MVALRAIQCYKPAMARPSPATGTSVKAAALVNRPLVGDREHRARSPEVTDEGRYPWLDSSLDLERGLDIVELTFKQAARVFHAPNLAHLRHGDG